MRLRYNPMARRTRWLNYRPLTDHNYWRVLASALRDASLSDLELARKVEYLGSSVLSGGLIMDGNGTLMAAISSTGTVVSLTMSPGISCAQKSSSAIRQDFPVQTVLRSAAAIPTSPIPSSRC
jgi:hypothetical protein